MPEYIYIDFRHIMVVMMVMLTIVGYKLSASEEKEHSGPMPGNMWILRIVGQTITKHYNMITMIVTSGAKRRMVGEREARLNLILLLSSSSNPSTLRQILRLLSKV